MSPSTTIMVTVLSGVSVFVIGQFLLKLVVDPIAGFRQRIGAVAYLLLSHQAKIVNASNSDEGVQTSFKQHAAELIVAMSLIPAYRTVAVVFGLPSEGDVFEAARELNGISHNIGPINEGQIHRAISENLVALKKLGTLLGIRTKYSV